MTFAIDDAKKIASERWNNPPVVTGLDFTPYLPWLRNHKVFLMESSGKEMIIAWSTNGEVFIFDRAGALETLNRLFENEPVRLYEIEPQQLSQAIRGFLQVSFLGRVGSKELLAEEHSDPRWVQVDSDLERFECHCQGPNLTHADGAWQLDFNFFNSNGGVEGWSVKGSANQIDSFNSEIVTAAQTFNCPYV